MGAGDMQNPEQAQKEATVGRVDVDGVGIEYEREGEDKWCRPRRRRRGTLGPRRRMCGRVAGTSRVDLADRAGVTRATFYNRYSSPLDLLIQVLYADLELSQRLKEARRAEGRLSAEQIVRLVISDVGGFIHAYLRHRRVSGHPAAGLTLRRHAVSQCVTDICQVAAGMTDHMTRKCQSDRCRGTQPASSYLEGSLIKRR